MALKIPVELERVRDLLVDDGARRAVATLVLVAPRPREEPDMVPLPNHDHGDFGVDLEVGACLCG